MQIYLLWGNAKSLLQFVEYETTIEEGTQHAGLSWLLHVD